MYYLSEIAIVPDRSICCGIDRPLGWIWIFAIGEIQEGSDSSHIELYGFIMKSYAL